MNLRFLETINKKNFILCNPNSDELMVIQHKDENLDIWLNDIWELSFTVDNLNINGVNDNLYYPLIIKDRIIKIQEIGEFVITDIKENDNGISQSKQVTCKSLEYNITKKSISYMECKAYKFYNAISTNISNTFIGIIMSYLPNWTIGHIDTELYNLYRIFDISSDTSIYNLMIENAQAAYECIFQFDRLNKTINAYTRDNIVKETDIFASFDNLINELNITPLNDGLCTALIVNGANDMSINLVNPLGTSTIYNLDNVIDNIDKKTGIRLMTLDTANAWKNWKTQYDNLKISYANNLLSIKNKKSEILNLKAQLSNINAEIKALNTSIASFDTLEEDKTDLVNQYDSKVIERNNIENSINTLNNEITNLEEQLKQTNSTLKFSSFFTSTQLKELDNFITVGNYSDDNFAVTDSMTDVEVIEMTQELFDKAQRQLNIVSKNRYSFDINMLCPFFVENFLTFKEQLDLGCQITLKDSKENCYYPLLIGISISFDKLNDVKFTFSESLKNQNEEFNLSQLLGKTANVATNLSMNNLKYNAYVDSGDKETLHRLRNDALNADLNSVINSSNQEIIIDDTGILGRKLLDDGNYDNKQYRFTNQQLLFTDDTWKHAKLGIGNISLPNGLKAYGINGEVIMGNMLIGSNLGIHNVNNSFVVDENGATLTNATLSIIGNGGLNKMLFDPINGFKIQKKVNNEFNDMIYLDSNGDANFSGNIRGGSINIANKFKVNADGSVEMASGTLKSFQSLMSNGKGLKVNDGVSNVDGDCTITGNLVVRGNTTLGGNIIWETHDTKFNDYSTTAQMNAAIKTSADNISLSVGNTLKNYSTTTQMDSAIQLFADNINLSVSEKFTSYSTTTQMNAAINLSAQGVTATINNQINGINQSITSIKVTSDAVAVAVNNNKLKFDSSGLSIYNAGFSIYNGSNKVFYVDTSGNVITKGYYYGNGVTCDANGLTISQGGKFKITYGSSTRFDIDNSGNIRCGSISINQYSVGDGKMIFQANNEGIKVNGLNVYSGAVGGFTYLALSVGQGIGTTGEINMYGRLVLNKDLSYKSRTFNNVKRFADLTANDYVIVGY